jgi:polar amino acid transport system substrate-binding protein
MSISRILLHALFVTTLLFVSAHTHVAQALDGDRNSADTATLRFGVEGGNPPFNSRDDQGRLSGFEVELGKAVCQTLKKICDFVQMDWDQMRGALRTGSIDAIMSSVEITDRRRIRLAFTKPYYRLPRLFIAQPGRFKIPLDSSSIGAARLGAVSGTRDADRLAALYPLADIKLYAKAEDAYLDLVSERVDLVLSEWTKFHRFIAAPGKDGCCVVVTEVPFNALHDSVGFGIAMRFEREELRNKLDEALDALRADGTWEALRKKHVGFDLR